MMDNILEQAASNAMTIGPTLLAEIRLHAWNAASSATRRDR